MRVTGMIPQAVVPAAPRLRPRGTPGSAARVEPVAPVVRPMGPRLPLAVADRLASLLASDPGLAEAVTAQLPAARQASALDLATYGTGSSRRNAFNLDTTS